MDHGTQDGTRLSWIDLAGIKDLPPAIQYATWLDSSALEGLARAFSASPPVCSFGARGSGIARLEYSEILARGIEVFRRSIARRIPSAGSCCLQHLHRCAQRVGWNRWAAWSAWFLSCDSGRLV